jgi:hypothetical protein
MERAPGEAPSSLITKAAGGVGGWGGRFSFAIRYDLPIKCKSAIGEYPLFLGIPGSITRKEKRSGQRAAAPNARRPPHVPWRRPQPIHPARLALTARRFLPPWSVEGLDIGSNDLVNRPASCFAVPADRRPNHP